MDSASLNRALDGLPLGGLRYLPQTTSTNDEAARWLQDGAPDLAVVAADEQTAGRGRLGRRWHTPPGAALAFSLALRGEALPPASTRLAGLGALAVSDALITACGLPAQVKWPNDVLVDGKKLCGVLVEGHWRGDRLEGAILGVGVNVAAASVPPAEGLNYPATCVENCAGRPVERLALLRAILERLLHWRPRLASPEFLNAWERRLAFRGQSVQVTLENTPPVYGVVAGLSLEGGLRLRRPNGIETVVQVGEVRPLPAN